MMRGFMRANLNIDNLGGVVASPDRNTPGGTYYWNWERDAALSMRMWYEHSDDSASNLAAMMDSYVQWVLRAQNQVDPNGIDIRAEPKYHLPNANVFTGGWCRPQDDGPALRSTTLILFATDLLASNSMSYVAKYLWTGSESHYHGGAIKYDLDYVAANWASDTCDLWEELRSNDFFWNRYNYYRALVDGAAFATKMGDSESAATYSAAAGKVLAALGDHWNGQFIQESSNRQKGASVICALNDAYMGSSVEANFAPTSSWVAATVNVLSATFTDMFKINTIDTQNGIPGVLYGRYAGDTYAGGNPWILTTAALAQLHYRAASEVVNVGKLPHDALPHYAEMFGESAESLGKLSVANFALRLASAGDGVLERIRYHVAGAGFHLSEQLDRDTGFEMSATDLTWSYANVLKAVAARDAFVVAYERMMA